MEIPVLNDATTQAINDLWQLWEDEDRKRKEPPAGSRTVAQHAKLKGIGEKAALKLFNSGIAAGTIKAEMFIVRGHICRYYWPVDTKCPKSTPSTNGRIGKKRRISG